jgi:ribosomal protein L11 methyltransferase
MKTVDWQAQWAQFAPNFCEGLAHIDLTPYGGPPLLLQPGAGFGDFSHPTTRLSLALLAPLAKQSDTLIDIGCGSGILSLAAVLLGVRQAIGIDIEESALHHSRENARLNYLEQKTTFTTAQGFRRPKAKQTLIVMNMISSEQQIAWTSLPPLHDLPATILTSGILATERSHYLHLTTQRRWTLVEEREEEGWLGFRFTTH